MVQWHSKSKRNASGGRRTSIRRSDKKLAWRGGNPSHTKTGKDKTTIVMGRGRTTKTKLLQAKQATIVDPRTKKTAKAEIIAVAENPANRQFTRQNIITKGATIKVSIGGKEAIAKVTSRPGQSGTVHAVLQ